MHLHVLLKAVFQKNIWKTITLLKIELSLFLNYF